MTSTLILSTFALLATPSTDGPASVYSDGRHLNVTVVPLSDGRVAASFSNTRSLLDGRYIVLDAKGGSRPRLVYRADDGFQVYLDGGDSDPTPGSYLLTTPTHRATPVTLYFDREASAKANADDLRQRALAMNETPPLELDAANTAAAKACGTDPWKLALDPAPGIEASTVCAEAVAAIAGLCSDELAKEAVAAKLRQLSCVIGTTNRVQLDGQTLRLEAAPGSANHYGATRAALLEQL